MKIKEFYNNRNRNLTLTNSKNSERDVRNWCLKLCDWQIADYINYYKDIKVKPYFNSYNRLHSNIYYEVPYSVQIANELLLHQYSNSTEFHNR